jgi:hypothetical protein
MPDYLSTDPNAGDESAGYLSTDPNAGEEPASKSGGSLRTPAILAGAGIAKAGPAITGLVSKGAKAVSAVDPVVASIVGSAVPYVGAGIGAATPKVAKGLAKLTAPAEAINTGSQFLKATSKAGPLMQGAGWLSRMAGKASLPLTLLSLLMDAKNQADQLEADDSIDPAMKDQIRLRIARPFEQ